MTHHFPHRLNEKGGAFGGIVQTDEEWSEIFSSEVRRTLHGLVLFTQEMANPIAEMLDDPIENEESIRKILGSFGVSIHMSSPRGENRYDDVVGKGRKVVWECGNDGCTYDHCTICGKHQSNAGDGHTPWFNENLPPCKSKPRFRKDVREEE